MLSMVKEGREPAGYLHSLGMAPLVAPDARIKGR
jgi:hypothetical protein